MDKLHFLINISAPREKVWNIMLGEETYRVWTEPFMKGSHYQGDWNRGSKILFLAPGDDGQMSGMVSRIKENRPFEYISIEHLGEVHNGKEDTAGDSAKTWAGAHENYTFEEAGGITTVSIDMDTDEKLKMMFQEIWPKALQKLKELSEK